jgi:hypothetical protein
MDDSTTPSPRTTAAAVSSHDVSIASTGDESPSSLTRFPPQSTNLQKQIRVRDSLADPADQDSAEQIPDRDNP